jgi:hypothetical protein
MMAIAASRAASQLDPVAKPACKPRANCLNPKEIRKIGRSRHLKRFDLRGSLNYLKVKTIGRHPTSEKLATPVSALPRGLQAGMIAS